MGSQYLKRHNLAPGMAPDKKLQLVQCMSDSPFGRVGLTDCNVGHQDGRWLAWYQLTATRNKWADEEALNAGWSIGTALMVAGCTP